MAAADATPGVTLNVNVTSSPNAFCARARTSPSDTASFMRDLSLAPGRRWDSMPGTGRGSDRQRCNLHRVGTAFRSFWEPASVSPVSSKSRRPGSAERRSRRSRSPNPAPSASGCVTRRQRRAGRRVRFARAGCAADRRAIVRGARARQGHRTRRNRICRPNDREDVARKAPLATCCFRLASAGFLRIAGSGPLTFPCGGPDISKVKMNAVPRPSASR